MRAERVVANLLATDTFQGIMIGSSLRHVDPLLGQDHVEEVHGKGPGRLLRRDYGLVEVTFGGNGEWTCRFVIIEAHRLAMGDVCGLPGVEVGESGDRYGSWSRVLAELDEIGLADRVHQAAKDSTYADYRPAGMNAVAHVVVDESWERTDDSPGFGDVWSVSLAQRSRS